MDMVGFQPWIRIERSFRNTYNLEALDRIRLSKYKRITGTFVDINKEYDVFIDHTTVHLFPISEYDEYDVAKCPRAVDDGWLRWLTCLLTVPTKFWGPTPILNVIGIRQIKKIAVKGNCSVEDVDLVQVFIRSVESARKELWTDYQQQLFHSEYFRVNRASYYYLIETLSSKKWE